MPRARGRGRRPASARPGVTLGAVTHSQTERAEAGAASPRGEAQVPPAPSDHNPVSGVFYFYFELSVLWKTPVCDHMIYFFLFSFFSLKTMRGRFKRANWSDGTADVAAGSCPLPGETAAAPGEPDTPPPVFTVREARGSKKGRRTFCSASKYSELSVSGRLRVKCRWAPTAHTPPQEETFLY